MASVALRSSRSLLISHRLGIIRARLPTSSSGSRPDSAPTPSHDCSTASARPAAPDITAGAPRRPTSRGSADLDRRQKRVSRQNYWTGPEREPEKRARCYTPPRRSVWRCYASLASVFPLYPHRARCKPEDNDRDRIVVGDIPERQHSIHETENQMTITNRQSGTNVHEIADGIYRVNTPVLIEGAGGFSFNQYLIVDDEPLLFHTGPRKMFPLVHEAVMSVLPVERLRFLAFSHVEADECGSLNEWLAVAPQSVPVCGSVAAMVSIGDLADRAPRALADGELLSLGKHSVRWFDTPHLPHAWECGLLTEERTSTLFCGDLFTQGGSDLPPITESDILGPSEGFRRAMDYFSHTKNARVMLERLARANPVTLACMHGSAWRGDGAKLLRALADALSA